MTAVAATPFQDFRTSTDRSIWKGANLVAVAGTQYGVIRYTRATMPRIGDYIVVAKQLGRIESLSSDRSVASVLHTDGHVSTELLKNARKVQVQVA